MNGDNALTLDVHSPPSNLRVRGWRLRELADGAIPPARAVVETTRDSVTRAHLTLHLARAAVPPAPCAPNPLKTP